MFLMMSHFVMMYGFSSSLSARALISLSVWLIVKAIFLPAEFLRLFLSGSLQEVLLPELSSHYTENKIAIVPTP